MIKVIIMEKEQYESILKEFMTLSMETQLLPEKESEQMVTKFMNQYSETQICEMFETLLKDKETFEKHINKILKNVITGYFF